MSNRIISFLAFLLVSCSSHYHTLYTMDDSDRPEWAVESVSYIEDGEDAHFIGFYETNKGPDLNMNAVRKASEIKSWDEVSKKVVVEYQNEAELTSSGMNVSEELHERSKVATKSIMKNAKISGRWYRVLEQEIEGETIHTIQYFTRVTIKKSQIKRAVANIK